ncbi:MAG: hypothetical protein Q9167_005597 [Letrouitia subvulpina]
MSQTIEKAFSSQPDLHRQILKTLQTYPNLHPLFSSVSTYIQDLKSQNPSSYPVNASQPPQLSNKKRKLSFSSPSSAADEKADSISDLSFSIPQRKKLRLDLSHSSATGFLKAINTSTLDFEFGIPYSAIATTICVPVPEKAQPQYNFCILPAERSGHEQILFTVPNTKPKEGAAAVEGGLREDESYKDLVVRLLNARLPHGQLVLQPDPKEFSSSHAAPGGKTKAMHVKAFRGNKEGFLFFLPHGILFAFKKPLLFLPFAAITSISYTSVLQRTFNLAVTTHHAKAEEAEEEEEEEIEFSMLDQADYAAIDTYVKRHGLHDASMAEARRAKPLHVNGRVEDGEEGEEEGELEKARREAEDEEDEEEEDENFDPGSAGESEGEGGSSSDEEEEGGQLNTGKEQRDLVREELGSEAEEIDVDEEEEEEL